MNYKEEWFPPEHRGRLKGAKIAWTLKQFGIPLTIGDCRIQHREQTGEHHWVVWVGDGDDVLNIEQFKRLEDAIHFALNPVLVASAIAYEKGTDATP